METLTFDLLPKAVTQLCEDMADVKRYLLEQSNDSQPSPDRWFDLNELVSYDPEKRSKPTFYGYVHERTIPFHKRGKKIIFLKSEIDFWLKQGRKKTLSESAAEADQYLSKKKGLYNGK